MSEISVYGAMQGGPTGPDFRDNVVRLARTCESVGFTGALLHYNHRTVDAWQLASYLLDRTTSFVPLIAVQPYSAAPFTVAKAIATIAYLHGRRVDLNMVSGSSPWELKDICDPLSHTERYERLGEFIQVLQGLLGLEGDERFSFVGEHYRYETLHYFESGMNKDLMPQFFMAGASGAGKWTASERGCCLITNPEPIEKFVNGFATSIDASKGSGVRFGIISRESDTEAWDVAKAYFPFDEEGFRRELVYSKGNESAWRQNIAELSSRELYDGVYWLGPSRISRSYSPFLVGSHERVEAYLKQYVDHGVDTLILASPLDEYEANGELIDRIRKTD